MHFHFINWFPLQKVKIRDENIETKQKHYHKQVQFIIHLKEIDFYKIRQRNIQERNQSQVNNQRDKFYFINLNIEMITSNWQIK